MAETALAHALKTAGVNTEAARARVIAEKELRRCARMPERALEPFVAVLQAQGGIMAEVVSEASLRADALAYLRRVAADMRGEGLRVAANPTPSDPVPSRDGGGVRFGHESHRVVGFPEKREGDEVRVNVAGQSENGPSPSRPVGEGAVRIRDESQRATGRVFAIPKPARGLDAMQARKELTTIMDTYLTRDGIPIGDVQWSALPRIAITNQREAVLCKMIYEHGTPADPNARVRDILKVDELQRMMQKSTELAHA